MAKTANTKKKKTDKEWIEDIKKMKIGNNDIIVMQTSSDTYDREVLGKIHNELKHKRDWDGVILITKEGETIEAMGEREQRMMLEKWRKQFKVKDFKTTKDYEQRRFQFNVWFDRDTGTCCCVPITDNAGRPIADAIMISDANGNIPRPTGPGDWVPCQTEFRVNVPKEVKKGTVLIEK